MFQILFAMNLINMKQPDFLKVMNFQVCFVSVLVVMSQPVHPILPFHLFVRA